MDEKVKRIVIAAIAAVAVVIACLVVFQTVHSTSSSDGVADSAREIMSHSNNTQVLTDDQKKDVIAHGMGPGGKPGPLKSSN